jgi:hypothetical protein
MMTSVSDMILGQFAGNFEIKAMASAPADVGSSTPDVAPTSRETAPAAQAVTELNGLEIVWMLIKDFFGRLFGRKS